MQPRALVTGAGARLGKAMAIYLAERGFDVAVHYATSADGAQKTVDEIEALGRNAVALQADFLDLAQCEGLLGRASLALGGPITCLVNNASIFEYDTIETASRESWDRHMTSNLRAPFILTQAFAAQFSGIERRDTIPATIINLVDQRVRKLNPEFMTYSLAKQALWNLTQTSAQALAPHIRVNAIGPGTTLIGAHQTQEYFDAQRKNSLLERGADVEDIKAALGYFLDAQSVTGQLLCVDGGQHLTWHSRDTLRKSTH